MWADFLGCDHTRIPASQVVSFNSGKPNNQLTTNEQVILFTYSHMRDD